MTPLILDVTISGLLLALSHVAAAGLGYFMCHWLTMRVFDEESETEMTHPHKTAETRPPLSVITIILVAGVVLVGIGVQSLLSQRADDAHDKCVAKWGDELITTVGTRGAAAERLETAQTARDDALDSLLVAAIGIQDVPEDKKQKALANLVTGYVESVDHLRKVQKNTTRTRERNPFPPLNC